MVRKMKMILIIQLHYRMVLFIKDNVLTVKNMEKVIKSGQTVPVIQACGKMIKQMEKDN